MSESTTTLEEEVLELYRSPIIGASYNNTFGEENIQSLVEKCRNLDAVSYTHLRAHET